MYRYEKGVGFFDIFHCAFGRQGIIHHYWIQLSVMKQCRRHSMKILQHAAVGSACVYGEVGSVLVLDFLWVSGYVWNINDLFTPLIALPRGAEWWKRKLGVESQRWVSGLFSQHPCLRVKIILQPVCSLQTQCWLLRNTDMSQVELTLYC